MKSRFYTVLLVLCLFGSIRTIAQTWVPHTNDTNLNGVFGLRQFLHLGSDIYTFTNETWYRINDISQPWVEPDQAGISGGHQLYLRAFVISDTIFCLNQYHEWIFSSDSANSWQFFTPNGFPVLPSYVDMRFYNFREKRLAWWGSDVYTTTDGFNWIHSGITTDVLQVIEDSVLRVHSAPTYTIYDTNFVALHGAPNLNPPGWNSNYRGRYVYSFQPGCDTSTCWDSIYRYDVTSAAPVRLPYAEMIYDSVFEDCLPISYYVVDSMHLLIGNYLSTTGNSAQLYYLSVDDGATWNQRQDLKWIGYGWEIGMLGDDTLYAFDNHAFNYRYSIDGGANWQIFPSDVKGLDYSQICYSVTGDTMLWYKHTDGGGYHYGQSLFKSHDGGLTWSRSASGMGMIVSASDTSVPCYSRSSAPYRCGNQFMVWQEDASRMYRSSDGGTSWQQTNIPPGSAMILSGSDDNEFFIDGYYFSTNVDHFNRTSDGGQTWSPMQVPRGDSVNGANWNNTVIQGIHDTLLSKYDQYDLNLSLVHFIRHLFLSPDDGVTWNDITPPQLLNNFGRIIDVSILYGPVVLAYGERADQFMMVTRWVDSTANSSMTYWAPTMFMDSLYWFDGTNWTVIQHTGLPADIDIQSLLRRGSDYYLGSNYGVYVSSDSGLTWSQSSLRLAQPSTQANQGFTGRLQLYTLNIFTTSILVGTDGNGMWRYDFGPMQTEETQTTQSATVTAYPVPVNAGDQISWSVVTENTEIVFTMFDSRGAVVLNNTISNYSSGTVETITTAGLRSGIYMLTVSDGVNLFVRDVVIE